jgi:uncharacterized protein (TIGR02246 family)
MTRLFCIFLVFAMAILTFGCAGPADSVEPIDLSEEAEAAVFATVKAFNAAAESKDAEAFASFYTDDAMVLLEQLPLVQGVDSIQPTIAAMMQDPTFELSFEPDNIVGARSGELVYETGTYSMTFTGAEGGMVAQDGNYVAVWQKQEDGSWKCSVDAPVSSAPALAVAYK